MQLTLEKTSVITKNQHILILCAEKSVKNLTDPFLTKEEQEYIISKSEKDKNHFFAFNRLSQFILISLYKEENKDISKQCEELRKSGNELLPFIKQNGLEELIITGESNFTQQILAFAEGLVLGNYQFLKYKINQKPEERNPLKKILIYDDALKAEELLEMNTLIEAVCQCRNLVNEPVCYLNAVQLAEAFEKMGKEVGIKTEILTQSKIEALKMGGLLAVNKGSVDPATFTIMEWKPSDAKNKKPVVLVGKGIVYDTGGLNLKPDNYMSDMKDDMAGAAMMACTLWVVAKQKLPVHVIALLPSTDNRPGGNAYAPGDIITMFDGKTVEVIDTDAEGRLILADALAYAKKYNPQLVIDAATLTGAAQRAIGKYGIAAMQHNAEAEINLLKAIGDNVYERIVEFPFWEEYGELMKSEIADLKNVGGSTAGMITAGKFLEFFTDYPFIHLDIAGMAFMDERDSYRGKGATGVGTRLLYHFLKQLQ